MNSPSAPNPVAAPNGSPAGELPVRKLNNPFFALKAPDNLSTYFDSFNVRVVKAQSEPLARFLADAHEGADATGRGRQVAYSLGSTPLENPRPLRFLPPGELEGFEKAALAFYEKAHPDKHVVVTEKELRKAFKLPDPDLEPEAYWLYGGRFDPKLLILWGCEQARETSLPLIEDLALQPTKSPTVAQRLRHRLLSWEQMQLEALALIEANDEPLGRFLALPVLNEKGQLVALEQRGVRIPLSGTRPLNRTLAAAELEAFDRAAREFYRQAHPDQCDCAPCKEQVLPTAPGAASAPRKLISAYERDLRLNFKLPDPNRFPFAYRLRGSSLSGRLIVLCPRPDVSLAEVVALEHQFKLAEGEQARRQLQDELATQKRICELYRDYQYQKEDCLCLSEDPVLKLPAETTAPGLTMRSSPILRYEAEPVTGPASTVVQQLGAFVINWTRVALKAAAGLVVLAALAGLGWWLVPKEVRLAKAEVSNDFALDPNNARNVILVSFNNALSQKSLLAKPMRGQVALAALEGNRRTPLTITNLSPDPADKKRLLLRSAEPLEEGKAYALTAEGFKDIWGNLLRNSQLPVGYRDERPPTVLRVTADPESLDKILVEFSEKLQRASSEERTNYAVPGFGIKNAVLLPEGNTVSVTADQAFKAEQKYTLVVWKVADASKQANPIGRLEIPFDYRPPPPRVQKILAAESQVRLLVQFNKTLETASAQTAANYVLDKANVLSARLLPDAKTVELATTAMTTNVPYSLLVRGVKDLAGKAGEESKVFQYTGPVRVEGPVLIDIAVTKEQQDRLVLTFDEDLQDPTPQDPGQYQLFHKQRETSSEWVKSDLQAQAAKGSGPRVLFLKLSSPLPQGSFRLDYAGVKDTLGNATKSGSKEFGNHTSVGWGIQVINNRLSEDRTQVILKFRGRLDRNCLKLENFKLAATHAGITISDLSSLEGPATTDVVLKLSAKITTDAFQGEWANLKLRDEVRLQDGRFGLAQ